MLEALEQRQPFALRRLQNLIGRLEQRDLRAANIARCRADAQFPGAKRQKQRDNRQNRRGNTDISGSTIISDVLYMVYNRRYNIRA
jgi:hypothetical protein